ncbi:putative membrane protein [Pyrobaculum oguniense TE7]|uniref:Membrane protein n=1 Tax=Pyrobaculum oguniense (strain DSM 13380 / JCM 10595 / TE7) TaxID=698757 RepID=H6QCA3_PYROT|nr:putative membrane protein [Pyrobaculum oguniense TE7]
MRRVVISVLSILAFSAVLALFPQFYLQALILYFIVFFGIAIFAGLRSYRKNLASAQEIAKGRPLLEIDEKDINKTLEKDKELLNEYKNLARKSFINFMILPLSLFVAMVLFPVLPPFVEASLKPYIGPEAGRFLGYVAIFSIFAAITTAMFRPITTPRIVRHLKVYETGIVVDKSLGLKAPIEVTDYRLNENRKFIEFKTNNQIFRIYYKDVKELDNILSRLIKPLKQ